MDVPDASSLIPWDDPTRKNGTTGGASPEVVSELCDVFDSSPVQQLAYRTVLSEVMRHPLAWHVPNSEAGLCDMTIPVPRWWRIFVADAIRSILITGCFVYRRVTRRAGVSFCIVGDPLEVGVLWCSKSSRYRATCSDHRWRVVIYEAPHRIAGRFSSGAMRALVATRRLEQCYANWCRRDASNSRSSVYTTVSSDVQKQNGSDRQWFRNVVSGDGLPSRAPDIDANFHTLVNRRAETIEKLDALTSLYRQRTSALGSGAGSGRSGCVPGSGMLPENNVDGEAEHQEHIISDGRVFTEARSLSSLADSKLFIDELKFQILQAFSVPPQALGQNINSERIAASNRLTEMALTTYTAYISELRSLIAESIREETQVESGSYVSFALRLPQYELEKLQPFLRDSVSAEMVSRTYSVPVGILDPSKTRVENPAAPVRPAHNAIATTATSPQESESVKRKRELVDGDPSRTLRNKANRPSDV